MANQPTPSRPWFRLRWIRAPPPAPTPAAEPRPVLQTPQPTQPSETSQAPPPPRPTAAQTPPPPTATAPPPTPATNATATPSFDATITSVPSSPTNKVSDPLWTSPIQKEASPPRPVLPAPTISSVPSLPQLKDPAPSSSLPTSPIPRAIISSAPAPPTTSNVTSVPSSPAAKLSAPASLLLPTSTTEKAAPTPTTVVSIATAPSVPSSPQVKVPASSSSVQTPNRRAFTSSTSVPTYPELKATQAKKSSLNAAADQSPKTMNPAFRTPPQSPKVQTTAPPPSPLTLPPSQLKPKEEMHSRIPLETEQKTVLVQENIQKPKSLYKGRGEVQKPDIVKNGKRQVSRETETRGKSDHNEVYDSEDIVGGARIITLSGENKGVIMELTQSPKTNGFGSNINNLHEKEHYISSSSCNDEDNVKRKGKSHEGKTKASPPVTAYMNSNVQGINNSIMHGSTCKYSEPGVHLKLSRKPFSHASKHKDHVTDHYHE